MKILTQQEVDEAQQAAINGGIKGAAVGLAASLALSLAAQRFSPGYRRLTFPLKAFFVTAGVSAITVIEAEHEMGAYEVERMRRRGPQNNTLEAVLHPEQVAAQQHQAQVAAVPTRPVAQRVTDYINNNRWSVVGGTWAAGMTGAGLYLWSKKYMTWQQKLVEARMYAQAITIFALLATAAISMTDKPVDSREAKDDSWRRRLTTAPEKNAVV
ncbi:hypothetical protein BDF22DRAFT_691572 [Syncephalis plumigaleata]|nr:hypothetical protein BDF22DRAFT_691572 [Syncephalis plumigaleata]